MAMEWTLLPNSTIPGAICQQLPAGGTAQSPQHAQITAWVNAAFDTQRRRIMLVRNGGHADGADNGVRSYSLEDFTWRLERPPSLNYPRMTTGVPDSDFQPIYSDGTPSACHTYGAVGYMPAPHHKVWSAGGIYWSRPGLSDPTTFLYNITSGEYEKVTNRTGGYGASCVWDPLTGRMLYRTSSTFSAWNPPTPSAPLGSNTVLYSASATMATASNLVLDPIGRKVYYIQFHSAAPFGIRMIDLNNLAAKDVLITTTGNTEVEGQCAGMGLIWDNDRLVAVGDNAGATAATLYVCNPSTGVWVRQTTTGVSAPIPHANGVWNKFFKDPSNGNYYYLTISGIYTITPDTTAVPASNPIEVASDIQVDFAFEAAPPDPPTLPGGSGPLAVNTWTMVPTKPANAPESERSGKHMRMVLDSLRERFLIFAGDRLGSGEGQPAVQAYNTTTGAATLLSPSCPPAPEYMPNWPDNVPCVYIPSKDQVYMFRGFWNVTPISVTVSSAPLVAHSTALTAGVTVTTTGNIFESWHATGYESTQAVSPGGFSIRQTSTAGVTIANARITSVLSANQAVVNPSTGIAFPSTGVIAAGRWMFYQLWKGVAAKPVSQSRCDRNYFAGDRTVLQEAAIYDCASNKWLPPTWPRSPLGIGSDNNGPSWAVYHEATNSVYMASKLGGSNNIMILNVATNQWQVVPAGAGMPTGAERTLVTGANSYRSQMALANDTIYFMSNKFNAQCLISFHIPTRVWHAFPVPQTPMAYASIPDECEPLLIYDPVSNVLLHLHAQDLTGVATVLYPFNLNSNQWEVPRAIPFFAADPVKAGCPYWDPFTASMGIMGRSIGGVPGYVNWHYRYQAT